MTEGEHAPSFTWLGAAAIGVVIVIVGVLAAWVVWTAPASCPRSDLAVIEIDVLHSLNGFWKLGAYSRYGWRHPGPLQFYLLAPLYWLSGERSAALPAGALLLNVACLAFVARALMRRLSPWSASAVTLVLFVLAVRADGLMTSIWNPHAVVLPLAATIVAAALAAAGRPAFLGAAVVGASYVAQTHVGIAPAACALVLTPAVVLAAQAWRSYPGDAAVVRSRVRALGVATALGLVLWAPTLLDQVQGQPGNLSRIVSFFRSPERTGQPDAMAARIAGYEFASVWRPDLVLPEGKALNIRRARTWPMVGGAQMLALCGLLVFRRKPHRNEWWWLGFMVVVTTGVGLAASTRVESPVPDHVLFWLCAAGAIGSGLLVGAAADALPPLAPRRNRLGRCLELVPVVALVLTGVVGVVSLNRTVSRAASDVEANAAIREVAGHVEAYLRKLGGEPPLIRVSQSNWGEAAGVVLQLYKARQPIAIEPDWVVMFGEPLAPTGRESRELSLADRRTREMLLKAPGSVLVAGNDRVSAVLTDRR